MKKTQIHTMIEILAVKPFMLMWVSQLLTQVAFNMLVFMSGLILYEQSKTVFSISLLHMSVSIPSAIFALFSGVVVDRLDKKSVMIFSVILRALLLCGILYTIKLTSSLYIWLALIAMVSQMFVPAEAALIPRFVKKEHLLAANSLFIMTFYTAIIGGFVLGGLLLGMIGQLWMLILLLVIYIVSAVFLLFLPGIKDYETGRSQLQLSKLYADTINVFRYIKSTPLVFQAIMLLTLAQAIIQIFVTVGPGFADKILAIKITDASVFILGPATVGMIIGAIFIGSMGGIFRKRRLINTGIFLSGTLLVFMSLLTVFRQSDKLETVLERFFRASLESGLLPVSIICFFVIGFANALIDVSCNTILQEKTQESMRGKIYGILQSLINIVAVIPVMMSGLVADLFGIEKIILMLGSVLLIFGIYTSGLYTKVIKKLTIKN